MAWTDYSSSASGSWAWGSAPTSTGVILSVVVPPNPADIIVGVSVAATINNLENSYNIPGFEDGYQPAGVPNPIANNIGSGGGSVRPSSGFLYPRGY